jgi:glyoxalase superfamily protein
MAAARAGGSQVLLAGPAPGGAAVAVTGLLLAAAVVRGVAQVLLQRVGEARLTKNRMHLDIETSDVDAEVERLEGIGAHRLDRRARTEHGSRWVVMADPEGNEFCVCDGGAGGG